MSGNDSAIRHQLGTTLDLDETVDSLLGGHLVIAQHATGYRFSLDALLLAGAASEARDARVVDLGSGSGVVALALTWWHRPRRVLAVELQPQLVHLAWRNVDANRMASVVEVVAGDVREVRGLLEPGGYEVAICNPPYYPVDEGRLNPNLERAIARHELEGSLGDFVDAAAYALEPQGVVVLIYPAERVSTLLTELAGGGFRPEWLQFVHPRTGDDATLVLAAARRQGARPLSVRPPLVVHEGALYTPFVDALLSGSRPHWPGEAPVRRRGR